MKKVIVMGRSISANLVAAYLKKHQPHLDVVMLGKDNPKLPIVGESLIEISAFLLFELGLAEYLEEKQFHKIGLSFYMKENIDDTKDRTYAVHEATGGPPMPSFQINRFTFKKRLEELNEELGVRCIDGKITHVDTRAANDHQVAYEHNDQMCTLDANWVVDATGRRRLLARQYGLVRKPPFQRNTFWFRLQNFDRHFLEKINRVKPDQYVFDSYFATHHFMGRGNWIWCIPIQDVNQYTISVGVTWRPDLCDYQIKNIKEFCEAVSREHPIIAELVDSGEVVDENRYNDYLYEIAQVYSEKGWFLIGDAGNAVDPLYSVGIANTAVQIHQVNAMIEKGQREPLTAEFTQDLETCYRSTFYALHDAVNQQYNFMHDPYQFHFHMHAITLLYFYFILPCWLDKYHTDTVGARFISSMVANSKANFDTLVELLGAGSKRLGKVPSKDIYNYYEDVVNFRLWGPNEAQIPTHLVRMLHLLIRFRLKLLKNADWFHWPKHLKICLQDWLVSKFIQYTLTGKKIRESFLRRKLLKKPVGAVERGWSMQDEQALDLDEEEVSETTA